MTKKRARSDKRKGARNDKEGEGLAVTSPLHVVARLAKPAEAIPEIATHLSGARNDKKEGSQ